MASPFSLGVPSYGSYGGGLNMQGLATQIGQGGFPLAGTNPTYADRFKTAYQGVTCGSKICCTVDRLQYGKSNVSGGSGTNDAEA